MPGAARLVLDRFDDPGGRGEHRCAFGRGEILALVGVALATGAEAGARAAPRERARDGEVVSGRTWGFRGRALAPASRLGLDGALGLGQVVVGLAAAVELRHRVGRRRRGSAVT